MEWNKLKKELLENNSAMAEAYHRVDLSYSIAKMVIDGRLARGITQGELAELVGTKQPSIARIEKGGDNLPSLSFLQRIADALGTQLLPPRFEMLETKNLQANVFFDKGYKIDAHTVQETSLSYGLLLSSVNRGVDVNV